MKIVIATDSFKGSIGGKVAAQAAACGVKTVLPHAEIKTFSVSDGGEGLTESLIDAVGGEFRSACVTDPLGRKINATYGVIKDRGLFENGKDIAVIEVAAASGLTLLKSEERDPERASSRGTGELILAAVKDGYRNFLIGLGGSATNDCGVGMLGALGFSFYDKNGDVVEDGAAGVGKIKSFSADRAEPLLKDCKFAVACDVKNKLCGENGCSAVFLAQKGGTEEIAEKEDKAIRDFAALVKESYPYADENAAGAGAAGGLGYAFSAFLNAKILPGANTFLNLCGFDEEVRNADLVITGEGRMDGQSAMGKIPVGVAAVAEKYGVPTVALVGCVGDGAEKCNECGITAFFPIIDKPCSLERALSPETACENMKRTAAQVVRLFTGYKK